MAAWIDWHSHRTSPELPAEFGRRSGKKPHIDRCDFRDFSERLKISTERNSGKLLYL